MTAMTASRLQSVNPRVRDMRPSPPDDVAARVPDLQIRAKYERDPMVLYYRSKHNHLQRHIARLEASQEHLLLSATYPFHDRITPHVRARRIIPY
jgi:hypothetical protein